MWNDIEKYFNELSFQKLLELFKYQPESPMLFSTGLFLFLFTGFYIIYNSLHHRSNIRILYVILFSIYFYYKTSGLWFILLIFTATSDFFIGQIIPGTRSRTGKKLWITLSVCINLGMLTCFKYTNFLYELAIDFWHTVGGLMNEPVLEGMTYKPLDIFLPVGISFFTFQSLSYTIDIYRGQIKPVTKWTDYLFYVSFFPGLVAGPIVRAKDFIPQIYKKPALLYNQMGEALYLIICGLFKKCILSDYISVNFVDRIFDAPALYTGVENLIGVYGYALQIYCDFSGYSDMAIGIALLLGFRFNINFDSPYQSATITEFWRRWHISLSTWLRDYLYIPLGGNRKGTTRTYVNLITTMLLGGLWHGAALRFILWGAIHGIALAIHKLSMNLFGLKAGGAEMPLWRRITGTVFTFHVVCFAWIFFRAGTMEKAGEMLTQIFTHFEPGVFLQFVSGYRLIFILMVTGYIIHFLPKEIDLAIRRKITVMPLWAKAALLCIAIFAVIQMKSAEIVPFIYFQF
ncbi:MAG: MBOAT family protein [Tannerella sp.]|jgi:D-alanyl-lipoteichoic acid acyltransferase DltB (MBOAT superfamily)|nr:MBOAT family protein [Tannerella sp.]